MKNLDWKSFLETWATQKNLLDNYAQGDNFNSSLYNGATQEDIEKCEKRLGILLPTSYKDFLTVSNGWGQTTPFVYKLWSMTKIEWFRVRHQVDWIDPIVEGAKAACKTTGRSLDIADAEYFVYDNKQSNDVFRLEYLETTLEVSDVGDACVYLLNPKVTLANHEWEAWVLSTWGGIRRYRSFSELMGAEYEQFLQLTKPS